MSVVSTLEKLAAFGEVVPRTMFDGLRAFEQVQASALSKGWRQSEITKVVSFVRAEARERLDGDLRWQISEIKKKLRIH